MSYDELDLIRKGIEAATAGRRSKALSCTKKLSKFCSGISYRTQSQIFNTLSLQNTSSFDDDLQRSIDCAKRSIELAPKSIEFRWNLCQLLLLTAKHREDRLHFFKECKTALEVRQAKISKEFQVCIGNGLKSVESVKKDIKDLVVKCKEERNQRIRGYWSSLKNDEQLKLLTVSISHLTAHFGSWKDASFSVLVGTLLSESLSWVKENEKWEFWVCGCCNKKFAHPQLLREHVLNKNSARLPLFLERYEPMKPNTDWCTMIKYGVWKPVNFEAAISAIKEASVVDSSKFQLIPSEVKDNFLKMGWHSSQDHQCISHLEKIQTSLRDILDIQCLTSYHIETVLQFVMDRLQEYHSDLCLDNLGLEKTHLCVCCLREPDLAKLEVFLNDLYNSAHMKIMEFEGKFDELTYTRSLNYTERVRIILDDQFLQIHLDWNFLKGLHVFTESTEDNYPGVDRDFSALYLDTTLPSYEPPNSNDFLNWILKDSTIVEALDSWTNDNRDRVLLSRRLYSTLQKIVEIVTKTCQEKRDILNHLDCCQNIRKMMIDRLKNQKGAAQSREDGGHDREPVDISKMILEDWKSSLISHPDVPRTETNIKIVSEVLKQVLKMPAAYDGAINGLKAVETKDILDWEVIKRDGWIMQAKQRATKLVSDIDGFGKNNFQPILSVILHSYIQAQVENLSDNYFNAADATSAAETSGEQK